MHPAHRQSSAPPTDSDPAAQRLEQVWAATRPDPPRPELLDALWAHATAELDRLALAPEPAPTPGPGALHPRMGSPRHLGRWVGGALAAALVLLGAGLALRSGPLNQLGSGSGEAGVAPVGVATRSAVVAARPLAAVARTHPLIDVGVDQTLVVRLDPDGPRVDLQAQPEAPATSNALADNTQHDIFNAWESCATP